MDILVFYEIHFRIRPVLKSNLRYRMLEGFRAINHAVTNTLIKNEILVKL